MNMSHVISLSQSSTPEPWPNLKVPSLIRQFTEVAQKARRYIAVIRKSFITAYEGR